MNRLHERTRAEEGWALVTAVALMAIMLVMGLAGMAKVDFGSNQNRQAREREASLNLAEGVLYAQAFTLARKWPGASVETRYRFPAICRSSNSLDTERQCPNRDNIEATNSQAKAGAAFRSVEFLKEGKWTTRVRDNYGQLATTYDTRFAADNVTLTNGALACPQVPCAFDFNDDKAMWVEARSEVRGEPRKVVALMKLEMIQESVPRVGIAAGAIALTNNGAASYDVTGASATVNCTPDPPAPNSRSTCTNYKSYSQVTPAPVRGSGQNFMTPEQIERFRERAEIDKTYYPASYSGCPPLHGQVVFIERIEATQKCDYNPNPSGSTVPTQVAMCNPAPPAYSGMQHPCVNQLTKPGIVIVRCGGFTTSSNWTYVGVVYFVNGSDGKCAPGQVKGTTPASCSNSGGNEVIFESSGGAGIWGALAVDGNACIRLGSNSQLQVLFDPNVFNAVSSYGTVGLVQNTWRELPPGTN